MGLILRVRDGKGERGERANLVAFIDQLVGAGDELEAVDVVEF